MIMPARNLDTSCYTTPCVHWWCVDHTARQFDQLKLGISSRKASDQLASFKLKKREGEVFLLSRLAHTHTMNAKDSPVLAISQPENDGAGGPPHAGRRPVKPTHGGAGCGDRHHATRGYRFKVWAVGAAATASRESQRRRGLHLLAIETEEASGFYEYVVLDVELLPH